ncbi:MAG: asparagine synthase-related protein [Pseudomonadales bacterium]
MLSAIAHRGVDGARLCVDGHTALGYQSFWTTPEEVNEYQPLTDTSNQLSIVFDGRLDNRATLLKQLQNGDASLAHCSDATLVLSAYQHWGERCPEHFLGSFAFLIYDHKTNKGFCARDPMGSRTLFYHDRGKTLLVASEECALLAHPDISDALNNDRLASYFALQPPAMGDTFFKNIVELLPAHSLSFAGEHSTLTGYWSPKLHTLSPDLGNKAYAEQFLEILNLSVEARMRSITPVGAMLSGGMDSSPVAALAAKKLKAKDQTLRTYSWVFDELSACDERSYIDACNQYFNSEATHIKGDDCWPYHYPNEWPFNPNTPESNIFRHLKHRLYIASSANGSRVLLSGASGDLYYTGIDHWLVSNLRHQGIRTTLKAAHGIYQQWGLMALCRAMVRATGLRRPRITRHNAYSWMTSSSSHTAAAIRDAAIEPQDALRPAQQQQLLGSYTANGVSRESYHAYKAGIDVRDPFLDLRLVEFMLSVPDHQLFGPDGFKQIVRNATKGLLPEAVRLRPPNSSLEPLARKGFEQLDRSRVCGSSSLTQDILASHINMDWLGNIIDNGPTSEQDMLAFWQIYSFELWMSQRDIPL